MTTSQHAYRTFMHAQGAALPLCFQPWWLDVVCGGAEHWDAVMARDAGGHTTGILPYHRRRRWGLPMILMPPLTPALGPWLFYPEGQAQHKRFSFEERVMDELIAGLPRCAFMRIKCHPRLGNWLPFYWKGFRQTTRYTFQIQPADRDNWRTRLPYKVRHAVKKGDALNVLDTRPDPDACFNLIEKTFAAKGMRVPFSRALFDQLDAALAARDARQMYFARDAAGAAHAVLYLVEDTLAHYALFVGSDPEQRPYGAVPWLFAQAFERLRGDARVFDFEGSMLPGVARLFSRLGGTPVPYFMVYRFFWLSARRV